MFHTTVTNSTVNGSNQSTFRKIQLNPGQIFQGRVVKLFPNHIAALNLSGMSVTEKLEVGLAANQTCWFEVQPSNNIPKLKVLADFSNQQTKSSQPENTLILSQLGLSVTKANEILLNHFAKEQYPFTKSVIQNGANFMHETKLMNQEGLHTITTMAKRNLPLSVKTSK